MTVQIFERTRFEWHPGVRPERYHVLLGRTGAEVLELRAENEQLRTRLIELEAIIASA